MKKKILTGKERWRNFWQLVEVGGHGEISNFQEAIINSRFPPK